MNFLRYIRQMAAYATKPLAAMEAKYRLQTALTTYSSHTSATIIVVCHKAGNYE